MHHQLVIITISLTNTVLFTPIHDLQLKIIALRMRVERLNAELKYWLPFG